MSRSERSQALVLGNLIASTAWISAKYETSFAVERPLHLAIAILLFVGIFWIGAQKLHPASSDDDVDSKHELPDHEKNGRYQAVLSSPMRVFVAQQNTSLLVVIAVVVRAFTLWAIVANIQCSWNAVEVFLPVLLIIYNHVRGAHNSPASHNGFLLVISIVFAVSASLSGSEESTYIRSFPGIRASIAPVSQIIGLLLDAFIALSVKRSMKALDTTKHLQMFTKIALVSAAAITAIGGLLLVILPEHAKQYSSLNEATKKDILLGGFLDANVLASAFYLIRQYDITAVVTTTIYTAAYIHGLRRQIVHFARKSDFCFTALSMILFTAISGMYLLKKKDSRLQQPSGSDKTSLRALFAAGVFIGLTSVAFMTTSSLHPSLVDPATTIYELIKDARQTSDQWLKQASSSISLEEAVEQYRKRYRIPPPPHFDKWYKFATDRKSIIIDDFDQINHDLQPFWGLQPALIRAMTSHVLDRQWTEVAGLRIKGGKAQIGTHVLDTHRWMMEGAADLINTFAEFLPDMDLAFNINDESRVAVSHQDMKILMRDAIISRQEHATASEYLPFTGAGDKTWPSQFMNETPPYAIDVPSEHFIEASISPSFNKYGINSCDRSSLAHSWRWWNKGTHCPKCISPHTTSSFISNWTLAGSPCHQPDAANLHGFHLSPSAFKVTKQLFPIFSQSKIPSFSDIIYPSPWNYKDKVTYEENQDMLFGEKNKTLFWRGATSEGYAINNVWQGMQRQRFVQLLNHPPRSYQGVTKVNASFVDVPQRCFGMNCDAQIAVLDWGGPVDFQSHWSHRFLLDMDGAGFSGRFLPFLLSRSAVFRVASFRQWFEDRLTPWVHYVPLDTRGREIWKLLEYFGKKGVDDAEAIANEGRRRGEKVLRKEDMEIYMFRLLLEWGRVVDDNRKEVGFVLGQDG